jgi:aspartate/tyrosine/aromatic aminotransferase
VRIVELRELFVVAMNKRLPEVSFEHIRRQRGMFSQSGICGEAADRLKEDYSVYLLRSGRINVAGINATNLDPLCDAIAAVMSTSQSMV